MENAVEALKTAAAVLIFVIAITISFTMFSKAKASADAVLLSQDTQEYLESAELAGTLYTTTESASNNEKNNATITTDGYRLVEPDDVISTIYRYNLEKYGVTLVKSDGTVIARFDSSTETEIMTHWTTLQDEVKDKYATILKSNTTVTLSDSKIEPIFNIDTIEGLYKIEVDEGKSPIKCGAPWYGNETEIIKRINADIGGYGYILNRTKI